MALASLIFGGNFRTEFKNQDDGLFSNATTILTIDATIRTTHSSGASLTKRELEKGTDVSDHMTTAPESLILEGIISETPLGLIDTLIGSSIGAAASLASKAGAGGALATGLLGGALLGSLNGSRARDGYNLMVSLQKQRKIFDIVTGLKKHGNMMLTSITANRSAEIGKAIQFSATMEQVTFVTSKLISLDESKIRGGIGASAAGSTNLGKQTSSAAGSDTSSNGSIAFNLFGGLF